MPLGLTSPYQSAYIEQAQLAGEAMAKLRARLDMMNERKAVLEAQAEELQGKVWLV